MIREEVVASAGLGSTYFWGVELHADIERKFSIRRRKVVGAPSRISNIIRSALILVTMNGKIRKGRRIPNDLL